MHGSFCRLNGEVVHNFHGAGQNAGCDDHAHGVTRCLQRVVGCQDCAVQLRLGQQPQRDLQRHAKQSLRAHKQTHEVRAGTLLAFAAQLHQCAIRQHHAHCQHMVAGHAVLEAVCPAGVESDVAADGADGLAGRVGRIVEPVRGGCKRHIQIAHAWLHNSNALPGIDAQNAVEAAERNHYAVRHRQAAARKAGAAAARYKWHSVQVAQAHSFHHFGCSVGQHNRCGARPKHGERIRFIGLQMCGAGKQALGRIQALQVAQ